MDKRLSEDELSEIEGRVRAASPGPWKSHIEGRDHTSGSNIIITGTGEGIEPIGATIADQDFIAAARQDVPRLLEVVRVLRSLLLQRTK